MKHRLAIILLILLLTIHTACTSTTAPPNTTGTVETTNANSVNKKTIKIGVIEPLTGSYAAGGQLELEGIKLAHQHYNEVFGIPVELIIVDNQSDKVVTANAVSELIYDENVQAIIGSYGSSLSMVIGSIAQDGQVPVIAASATNPLVTINNDYYFRVCYNDAFQGEVMAKYAYNVESAKTAAIIQEISNDYSVGLAKYFSDAFIALTGDQQSIVAVLNYNTGDDDFNDQLQTITAKSPDIIFAPGNYSESALLIKQARAMGITLKFIGGDTWETDDFLQIGGDAVNGATFSTFFSSEVPASEFTKTFLDQYHTKYNKSPVATSALAYDAYRFLLYAAERAGSYEPVAVRDSLASTQSFTGAAGVITLDENGDAISSAIIKTVENGKFVYKTKIEPVDNH